MFRQIVGNNVFQRRNLLYFLHIYPSSLIRFISTDSTSHHNSFVISYLINTCGLSQQKAISASNHVHFDSPTKPDSVLTLLRNNGFCDSQISKLIALCPKLLVSSVDETLKPKFEFFSSKGLSGDDLAKVLSGQGRVLHCSMEKTIIPTFDFLKRILGTDAKVITMLKRSMCVVGTYKTIESKIAILLAHGVPMSNIETLLLSHPRIFLRNTSWFSEKAEEVKKMKFDPSEYRFLLAIHVMDSMSRSSLEAKFDVYKSWGWSEDQVQSAFRKFPHCMLLSEKNIISTMDYLVNKFGYAPSSIAEQPIVLLFSCERRIIPRCEAIQLLIKNGKIEQSTTLFSFLRMSETVFLKNYISRFEKEVPELLKAYQGEGKRNGIHP